jgi:hypothetical protein
MSSNIVKLMNGAVAQHEGHTIVLLPGGKKNTSVQDLDTSGTEHFTPPTGIGIDEANDNWGSGTCRIAYYPTYYGGSNTSGTPAQA